MSWSEDEPVDFSKELTEILSKLDLNNPEDVQKAFIEASQNGNHLIVKELLTNQTNVDINMKDPAGGTALTYGSCFGHELVVSELLRFGPDLDIQDKNEWTALMWAANNNHLSIVKLLVNAGANKQIKTTSGSSVFDLVSPSSAVGLYLLDFNEDVPTEFYKEAVDPIEMEAKFNHELKESADALGFTHVDDDEIVLGAPLTQKPQIREFDFETFKIRDSFALQREQIPLFLQTVITDFQPTLQKQQAPSSANALFLALRYLFYCGNTETFTELSAPICRRIGMAIDDHFNDLAYLSYWLANTEILLYLLQKDKTMNDATKDDLQLMLAREVEHASLTIQTQTQHLLTPLITACILNFDSIPEYGKVQYRDEWRIFKPKNSKETDLNELAKQHMLPPSYKTLMKSPGPQRVTQVLSSLLLLFQIYGVHSITQLQIMAELLYFMNSQLFNTIINERKYLNRRRAMQIRLNVSAVEDWCRTNNFRPESSNENVKFKSLIEVGRTFLAHLVQLLAWLQTFSGFGDDFTNVISTLQELKALNPQQLLQSATHYRFETREAPLSKDYKDYLKELTRHYDPKPVPKTPTKDTTPPKESIKTPTKDSNKSDDIIDLMSEPVPESASVLKPESKPEPTRSSSTKCDPTKCFIAEKYTLPVSGEILLDLELPLKEQLPVIEDAEAFWGQEMITGLNENMGSRYIVPYITDDLVGKLSKLTQTEDHDLSEIDEPEPAKANIDEVDEIANAWDLDEENVW